MILEYPDRPWIQSQVFLEVRSRGRFDTQKKRGYENRAERDLKMLALHSRVMPPQVKECWWLTEAEKGKKQILPIDVGESITLTTPGFQPNHTDFGLLASRTMRESISIVSSHRVWGNLLQQT